MLESTILENIITLDDFSSKVLIHLKHEYFQDPNNKILFSLINDYFKKFNRSPSLDALKIMISEDTTHFHNDEQFDDMIEHMENFGTGLIEDQEFIIDKAEGWCKERALTIAIDQAIEIVNGNTHGKNKLTETAIPQLMSDAISINFDDDLGFDPIRDAEAAHEFLTAPQNKIQFDLKTLNDITNGGVTTKTLNVILAGTHVGKTLIMSHLAAGYISKGYDVLYISLEEEELKLSQRLYSNLMDVNISDLHLLSQAQFMKNVGHIKNKTQGRMIYKQYPTASIHTGHLRNFMKELVIKEDFRPKIVMLDYLALMKSMRIVGDNSYNIVKAVSEEVRGLAIELNFALWSGAQMNRSGSQSSDPEMSDTAESFGLPFTADLYLAAVSSDDLKKQGQYKFKQLKNRYKGIGTNPVFGLGVDITKQRLHDLDSSSDEFTTRDPRKKPVFGDKSKELSFTEFDFNE